MLPHSQIEVVRRGGPGKALHVGVRKTGHLKILLLHQVGGQHGDQCHGGLGLEYDHKGQHAYLGRDVPLQEQAHADFLNLVTRSVT